MWLNDQIYGGNSVDTTTPYPHRTAPLPRPEILNLLCNIMDLIRLSGIGPILIPTEGGLEHPGSMCWLCTLHMHTFCVTSQGASLSLPCRLSISWAAQTAHRFYLMPSWTIDATIR